MERKIFVHLAFAIEEQKTSSDSHFSKNQTRAFAVNFRGLIKIHNRWELSVLNSNRHHTLLHGVVTDKRHEKNLLYIIIVGRKRKERRRVQKKRISHVRSFFSMKKLQIGYFLNKFFFFSKCVYLLLKLWTVERFTIANVCDFSKQLVFTQKRRLLRFIHFPSHRTILLL